MTIDPGKLNTILSAPTRLAAMVRLAAGDCKYTDLAGELGIPDATAQSVAIKPLAAAGYIQLDRRFGQRFYTALKLTDAGREALADHIRGFTELIAPIAHIVSDETTDNQSE